MKLITLHADTIYAMRNSGERNLLNNDMHIDITKMKNSNSILQCFAIYNKRFDSGYSYEEFLDLYDFYMKIINQYTDVISIINTYDDIEKNSKENKINVMITVEDGGPILGNIKRLKQLYEMGVRMLSFTWNYENCFGYPNSINHEINNKGLKKIGLEAIEAMNELGMIIDLSHLSDGGITDVLRFSKKPVVASHSNSRTITNHPRNLNDEAIRQIAENGGVIGLNFCPAFLGNDHKAKIDYMINHINHMVNVGGIDVIAIGSDFDGIKFKGEDDIMHIDEMYKLEEALVKNGFSNYEIEKIFYKNAIRVFRDSLK